MHFFNYPIIHHITKASVLEYRMKESSLSKILGGSLFNFSDVKHHSFIIFLVYSWYTIDLTRVKMMNFVIPFLKINLDSNSFVFGSFLIVTAMVCVVYVFNLDFMIHLFVSFLVSC